MKLAETDYRAIALRAHDWLADAPMHDAWRVPLEGGGDRTVQDLLDLFSLDEIVSSNPAVRFLFWLRGALGERVHPRLDSRREIRERVGRRPRHPRRRHHAGAKLGDDLLGDLGVSTGRLRVEGLQ